MRWALMIVAASTAACSDRRDFDERYIDTASELQERAEAIDANLSDTMNQAQTPSGRADPEQQHR